MSRVIELTDGIEPTIAADFYPDDEIEEYNPFVIREPLPYNDGELKGIFAHYILQKFHWRQTIGVVKDWGRCLEEDGLLHIIVPSRRWIARNMLQENIEPHVAPLLFGEYDMPTRSLLSVSDLRAMIDNAGLACIKAKIGLVKMKINDEEFEAEQIYVVGQKSSYIEETRDFV